MIIKQRRKPYIPKYANYDYVKVYDGNDSFIGWIRVYYELAKAGRLKEKMNKIVIKEKRNIDIQRGNG